MQIAKSFSFWHQNRSGASALAHGLCLIATCNSTNLACVLINFLQIIVMQAKRTHSSLFAQVYHNYTFRKYPIYFPINSLYCVNMEFVFLSLAPSSILSRLFCSRNTLHHRAQEFWLYLGAEKKMAWRLVYLQIIEHIPGKLQKCASS